eukprot:690069-Amphidinium_carterae.1
MGLLEQARRCWPRLANSSRKTAPLQTNRHIVAVPSLANVSEPGGHCCNILNGGSGLRLLLRSGCSWEASFAFPRLLARD